MSRYKLIIDDNIEENNHTCHCDWCIQTRKLGLEFNHYEPHTRLQHRMKDVIKKIEERYANTHKCNEYRIHGDTCDFCGICGYEF